MTPQSPDPTAGRPGARRPSCRGWLRALLGRPVVPDHSRVFRWSGNAEDGRGRVAATRLIPRQGADEGGPPPHAQEPTGHGPGGRCEEGSGGVTAPGTSGRRGSTLRPSAHPVSLPALHRELGWAGHHAWRRPSAQPSGPERTREGLVLTPQAAALTRRTSPHRLRHCPRPCGHFLASDTVCCCLAC